MGAAEKGRRHPQGPPVFIAWGAIGGRSVELAAAVGADVLLCYPPSARRRPPVLLRYFVSTCRTLWYLVARRPRAVIVTNPPIIPALLSCLYGVVTRAAVVLDDHPGSFGAQGYTVGAATAPLHRWAVAHARLCLVTDDSWVSVVERWGGRGLVLHESPSDWSPSPRRACGQPPRILFVCTFARDEPAAEVTAAAALLPQFQIAVTGDPSRRPPGPMPGNVELVGFLDHEDYRQTVEAADVILTLTTEPTSAMRAAFEAVWAEKVLVVSDWPLLRSLFPEAVHVGHTAEAIAAGLRDAVAGHSGFVAAAPRARERQLGRWADQLATLRGALGTGTLK